MLVLSRKVGERILVPQCGLSVTVVAVKGKTVRLAISAPAKIGIFREEIWHQVREDERPSGTFWVRKGEEAGSNRAGG